VLLKDTGNDHVHLTVSLRQLKTLYVALFRRLHAAGPAAFDDIDEDDMLLTIQTYLQRKAREAGVDATDHSQWEAFLGVQDAPSCEQRFRDRRPES